MTTTTTNPTSRAFEPTPTLERLLNDARRRIEVADSELEEARRRRRTISAILLREFPGSRVYVNGSIAHGDALTPLTDVDVGVVVAEAIDTHGPHKRGPADLQERAADALRTGLVVEFPEVRIVWRERKRSILVSFSKPVTPGTDDFTADVIVAIDNASAAGLYIPRFTGWDRAHPEKHTELVAEANDSSNVAYARTVRLLKHWNRNNQKPLCSWNIKALGLGCLTSPTPILAGIRAWFDYAIEELSAGETPDPAGVAPHPIKLNEKFTRTEVVTRLRKNAAQLEEAVTLEESGYRLLAHEQLAKFFNDPEMLPYPDPHATRAEADQKMADDRARRRAPQTADGRGAAAVTGPAFIPSTRQVKDVRSWAP